MRLVSWNVNGIRSAYKKGFSDWLDKEKGNIVCLQELRAREEQVPAELRERKDYFLCLNPAMRPGYAGTAVFSKTRPLKIIKEIGFERFDKEGRFTRLDFLDFVLINLYLPHGGRQKNDLGYKLKAYRRIIAYLKKIKNKDAVVLGDFNVARQEIDLARPKDNQENIMFTLEEREQLNKIIELGFVDSFRKFNSQPGNYTWWPYYRNCRQRNLGWRIDYVFVSKPLEAKLKQAFIDSKVEGSDHCPVGIEITNLDRKS